MLRQRVLEKWGSFKKKLLKFKAEGIGSNYVVMKKIALLSLHSNLLRTDDLKPAQGFLYDLNITNGSITKEATKIYSEHGVDLFTELLEVAIIRDLSTDEPSFLSNYDKLDPIGVGPTMEEVD